MRQFCKRCGEELKFFTRDGKKIAFHGDAPECRLRFTPPHKLYKATREYISPEHHCPSCLDKVHIFEPRPGDQVLFNDGPFPWAVHSCHTKPGGGFIRRARHVVLAPKLALRDSFGLELCAFQIARIISLEACDQITLRDPQRSRKLEVRISKNELSSFRLTRGDLMDAPALVAPDNPPAGEFWLYLLSSRLKRVAGFRGQL